MLSTAPKIAKSDALSHIFGYTCFNDGSIRDIQFKHSIAAGKNFHAIQRRARPMEVQVRT
jgi:2-keto-4-pentenoate hydratase/2-oxohepta-3-ene-1,7-dioic acid hydratase in catechol pathway